MFSTAAYTRALLNSGVAPVATLRHYRLAGRHPLKVMPYLIPVRDKVYLPPFDDAALVAQQLQVTWAAIELDNASRHQMHAVMESPYLRYLLCDLFWISAIDDHLARAQADDALTAPTAGWGSAQSTRREMAETILAEEVETQQENGEGRVNGTALVAVLRRLGAYPSLDAAEQILHELQTAQPADAYCCDEGAPTGTPGGDMFRVVLDALTVTCLGDISPEMLRRHRSLLHSRAARWACLLQACVRPKHDGIGELRRAFVGSQLLAAFVVKVLNNIRVAVIADIDPARNDVVAKDVYERITGSVVPCPPERPHSARAGRPASASLSAYGPSTSQVNIRGDTVRTLSPRTSSTVKSRTVPAATNGESDLVAELKTLFPMRNRRLLPAPPPPAPPAPPSLADQRYGVRSHSKLDLKQMSGAMETVGVRNAVTARNVTLTSSLDEVTARRRALIFGFAKNSITRAEAASTVAVKPKSRMETDPSADGLELQRKERIAVRKALERHDADAAARRSSSSVALRQFQADVRELSEAKIDTASDLRSSISQFEHLQSELEIALSRPESNATALWRLHHNCAQQLTALRRRLRFARIEGLV
jgi:hypothetical protein